MYVIGLTGGIASGKSVVAERLVQRHGAHLVDADVIAREVVLPGTAVWKRIVEHFGEEVLGEDGFLDRERLGGIVFGDPSARVLLNELTHPAILREIADELERLSGTDRLVVVDMALLVEIDPPLQFDAVVVVSAAEDSREQRLVEQREMPREAARQRIASQVGEEARLARATHVISNEGSLAELRDRVDEVAEELKAEARRKGARRSSGPA